MIGPLTPPTKPTLSVLVFRPAATPTRNEPCSGEKAEVGDVVTLGRTVDDGELQLRVLLGDRGHHRGVDEADRDDRVVARVREGAQALLLGGVRLVGSRLGLLAGRVEVLAGLLGAGRGQVVERLVAPPADVVGQADLGAAAAGRAEAALVGAAAGRARLCVLLGTTGHRERHDSGDSCNLGQPTQDASLFCAPPVRRKPGHTLIPGTAPGARSRRPRTKLLPVR